MTTASAALPPTAARWRVLAAALAAALVTGLVGTVPAARADHLWLVDASAALPAGARILGAFPVADALLVAAPRVPGAVRADTPVTPQTAGDLQVAPVVDPFAVDHAAAVGAPDVWADGNRGAGALVAVVDTGVAPVEALAEAVAGEIAFTGSGGGDGYGHGTVVASLIAGSSGVAPDAKILSLKVADDEGTVALMSVLDALQWLHGPGRHSGADVVVTALGVPADTQAAQLLDGAIGRVAESGRVVIAPTGNDGADSLTAPATAPQAIGIGATDVDGATTDFSGTGTDRAGRAKPDAVAPGTYIVGHTPADSYIAHTNPDAVRDGERIRGAGTSLSAAVAAGTAALAVAAKADPAKVADAMRLGGAPLDAPTLVDATRATAGRIPPGHARQRLDGTASWNGAGWGNPRWQGPALSGVRWVGVRWVGVRWVNGGWAGVRWVDDSWEGVRWVGVRWVGVRWVGVRWVGVRWVGVRWVGEQWTGDAWAGVRWVSWPEVTGR